MPFSLYVIFACSSSTLLIWISSQLRSLRSVVLPDPSISISTNPNPTTTVTVNPAQRRRRITFLFFEAVLQILYMAILVRIWPGASTNGDIKCLFCNATHQWHDDVGGKKQSQQIFWTSCLFRLSDPKNIRKMPQWTRYDSLYVVCQISNSKLLC